MDKQAIKDAIQKPDEGTELLLGDLHADHIRLTQEAEAASAAADAAWARVKNVAEAIAEVLRDSGLDRVTGGGFHSVLETTERYYLHAEDRPVAFDWLQEKGLGDIIKTEPSVNANTFSKTMRDLAATISLPEWVQHTIQTGVKLRKDQSAKGRAIREGSNG